MVKSINKGITNSVGISAALIPLLGFCLVILLTYMVWDIARYKLPNEGFTSQPNNAKSSNNAKTTARKTKNTTRISTKSKLYKMKNGSYSANKDIKNYGMDGTGNDTTDDEKETELDKTFEKKGTNMGKSTLKKLAKNRDNFKNVINEVDNINPGAFNLNSIGGTIRRYNENFNNRLNYAKSKNKDDNLEATMAQGKVIFDEFKKIFLFTEMF